MRGKILLLIVAALTLSLVPPAQTQQPKKMPRIAWIGYYDSRPPPPFMIGLRERGYIEGQSIIIEYRSAQGRYERLSEVAAELVRLKPDVIVAYANEATNAVKKATSTIPIVFLHGDPVWGGVVPSLAKPGGNLTGLGNVSAQLAGKRLEVFKDAVPKINHVAVLLDPDYPIHAGQYADMQVVARALGLQLQAMELRDSKLDFDWLFQQAIRRDANAVLTLPKPTVIFHRRRVLDLVKENRLPAMYPFAPFTDAGGLMSYGPNLVHQYRRAAYLVDRILKGAKPSDLPVEQPTKFELVINLQTAKTLGLTIPPKVLMWADRVIE